MKNRILRLCKRLDKFTLDDISIISEDIEESVLQFILATLEKEDKIILNNGVYFYNKKKTTSNNIIAAFQRVPKTSIDLVIRCYCSEIPADKTFQVVNLGEKTIFKLYNFIREFLYNRQYKYLQKLYNNCPQKGRMRKFFNAQNAYFYIYNNQVYIIDKLLHSTKEEKSFSRSEIQEFKKIYCYLSRVESHTKNKVNLYYKLAEALWRRNKTFDELYEDLRNNILLNIS